MSKFLIFLCFGVVSVSVFADLIDQNSAVPNDRLSELVKTVQGTYEAPPLKTTLRAEQSRVISAPQTQVKPIHPRIGMTKKQVLNNTTWGMPYSVRVTENRSGSYEYWSYGRQGNLTFKNGVLELINR